MQTFPKVGAALEAANGERMITALVGGITEGMTQASTVYEQALHETGDKDIAGDAMTKTLLSNIPLNAITNAVGYGVGHQVVEGAVKKAIMKIPLAAKLPAAAIDKASKVLAQ